MLNYIMQSQAKYNEVSEMTSSGKKLTTPSDNSYDAVTVLNIDKQLSQLNGYSNNMSLATNELDTLDGVTANITTQLNRANDLAIQAANGTNNTQSLTSIKTEVDQIIQTLKDLGNTQYNGSYMFSGTATGTVPFQDVTAPDGTTGTVYKGTTATEDYQRYIQISDNVKTPINVSGDTLLGSYDPVTKTGQGIMKTLYDFSNALGTGNTTGISDSIDKIQSGLDATSDTRTKFASLVNRFQMTTATTQSTITQLTSNRTALTDIDLTTAATQLATQQTALQATLAVAAKTLQSNSLLNYL